MNKQNNRFNIKLKVFELNFIYLAFLNFISFLISNIKTLLKRNLKNSSSNHLYIYSEIIDMPIPKESLKNV